MQVLKYTYFYADGKEWLQCYGLNGDLEKAEDRIPR